MVMWSYAVTVMLVSCRHKTFPCRKPLDFPSATGVDQV